MVRAEQEVEGRGGRRITEGVEVRNGRNAGRGEKRRGQVQEAKCCNKNTNQVAISCDGD